MPVNHRTARTAPWSVPEQSFSLFVRKKKKNQCDNNNKRRIHAAGLSVSQRKEVSKPLARNVFKKIGDILSGGTNDRIKSFRERN